MFRVSFERFIMKSQRKPMLKHRETKCLDKYEKTRDATPMLKSVSAR